MSQRAQPTLRRNGMEHRKPRLLFVQRSLQPPGGGGAVTAWAFEALKRDYDLTALTWDPVELEAVNHYYGTSLKAEDFRTIHAPALFRWMARFDPDTMSVQPLAYLMRQGKRLRGQFNGVVQMNNEADIGTGPTLQYIHYPYMARKFQRRDSRRLGERMRPWRVISGFELERFKQNVTLVNSDWTGRLVRAAYGVKTRTIYPPVTSTIPDVPWAERENGFVCIGRIHDAKRIERVIAILDGVRARGYAVSLQLIGSRDTDPRQRPYYQKIENFLTARRGWITFHDSIPHTELELLVARQRYGIHGADEEHFGIGVAEMVCGGCIVFVPNSGGQVEVVAKDARLMYNDADEAVEKICRVLANEEEQEQLREVLQRMRGEFSTERFMRELLAVAAQVFPRPC